MDDATQAHAYAAADFETPHSMFVELLAERIPSATRGGNILDLGCGPADVSIRFAHANPLSKVTGIDGAPVMVELGRHAVAAAGLADRISLQVGRLPAHRADSRAFDGVISNAFLHHLHNPFDLWEAAIAASKPNAWLFVMDLARPASAHDAARLVTVHAAAEPELLKRDFYNSLLAAYEPDEVRAQLARIGLHQTTVETVSDRHWIAWNDLLAA